MASAGDDRLDDGNGGFQFETQGNPFYIPSDDRLEGGPGNDELVSNMTAGPDHDRLYGGEGHDTFVYRLGEDTNPGVYGFDSRASGQDAVMDFEQGADRIDVRMEFTGIDEAVPYAHTGNFGLFDMNHDGVLSNADDLVHVTNVRIDGVTELSTILDMPPYYQPDPDTIDHLIVYGIDHLTQADFLPDQDLPLGFQGTEGTDVIAGNILENSIYGLAGNDTIYDGNGYGLTPLVDFDLIRGGNGDDNLILGVSAGDRDRVFGNAGHDQFVFRLDEAQPYGTGQDVVMDFAQGEDRLAFQVEETGSRQHPGTFAMFDSNHNGVLDNGDAHVSVCPITIDGVSKGSTLLQIADVLLPAEAHVPAADQRVIVWGQTHLTADDFSPATGGAFQVAAAPGIDTLVATASPEATG